MQELKAILQVVHLDFLIEFHQNSTSIDDFSATQFTKCITQAANLRAHKLLLCLFKSFAFLSHAHFVTIRWFRCLLCGVSGQNAKRRISFRLWADCFIYLNGSTLLGYLILHRLHNAQK